MERLTSWLRRREKAAGLRQLTPVRRLEAGRLQLATSGPETDQGPLLDFSSNDYLGLSRHPAVLAASRRALENFGAGAGAARLMSGDSELHHQLEQETARLKGKEAALLFGSGYLANAGIIPALVGRGDLIFCDRYNHASIYDGCLLSQARLRRFRHNDLNHLEHLLRQERGGGGHCLVAVESLYSMDGDMAPLAELVALKKRYPFLLLVDEAHATGLFGAKGAGLAEQEGVSAGVDVVMGTFGKALGSYGAYAAGSGEMMRYLLNRARTFLFSTALPPAVVGASLAALQVLRDEPDHRRELFRKVGLFKGWLQHGGLAQPLGPSQIIPLLVGENRLALELAAELRRQRLFATAIRPPTVPEGSARLRFSLTALHQDEELQEAAVLLLHAVSRLAPGLLAA